MVYSTNACFQIKNILRDQFILYDDNSKGKIFVQLHIVGGQGFVSVYLIVLTRKRLKFLRHAFFYPVYTRLLRLPEIL